MIYTSKHHILVTGNLFNSTNKKPFHQVNAKEAVSMLKKNNLYPWHSRVQSLIVKYFLISKYFLFSYWVSMVKMFLSNTVSLLRINNITTHILLFPLHFFFVAV